MNPSSRRSPKRAVDGLLLLDKPSGLTSNAALQAVKRLYNARKAGHTGSLDPLASGLLPICLGQATKLSAFLLDATKAYVVTMALGARTDTGDADGAVVERAPVASLDEARLREALDAFRGPINQVPPMYSALKQGGVRLYRLARAGEEVEREPRRVTIHELEIEHFDPLQPVLRVRCSKGTYVRTLVEDLAMACGTVAHVRALRRIAVGPFSAEQMVSLTRVEAAAAAGEAALDALLRPMDEALADWPAVELGPDEAYYLRQGHAVSGGCGPLKGRVRLYGKGHDFLGVGEALGNGRVAPRRLLVDTIRSGD